MALCYKIGKVHHTNHPESGIYVWSFKMEYHQEKKRGH